MESETFSSVYGKCRCCSQEGNHRDLFKEYCWEGIREVYSDIFIECFNISLSPIANLTTLICSKCINRLRDASSFKIQTINTERQLIEVQSTNNINIAFLKDAESDDVSYVKLEEEEHVKVESWLLGQSGDEYSDVLSDSEIFEDKISPITECNDLVEGELDLLSRFTPRQLRPLPTRTSLKYICANYADHLVSLEGKKVTGKTIETSLNNNTKKTDKLLNKQKRKQPKKPVHQLQKKSIYRTKYKEKPVNRTTEKNPYTLERYAHAANISAVLENSNVIAFKGKHQRAYPCFYCDKHFEDFEELRTHQTCEHRKDNMDQCVLQKYKRGKPDALVVYVDVTDLKCTLCNNQIANLKELKNHLTGVHGKKMHLELSDRVIPFKVKENNFECQICSNFYETFGSIERHMNTHYRNYVCEFCDSGFVTKQRLKIHGYLMHSNRLQRYPCEICQKEFTTQQKRRTHVETVHDNIKKYKCNRCPERFNEYFRRHKHMVLVHGVAPIEYKCNVCEKAFDRRYSLSTHMRTHIQQKDVYCELCPYRCFTKVELRHHMIKHNGERIHECSVCKKSYAREKTLKEHMRIHTNDRRYVCPVCGMAFIQNCSLKSHIKSHHKDYSLL